MSAQNVTSAVFVSDGKTQKLRRVRLGNGVFNEKWFANLIHSNPQLLPIIDLEPGFLPLRAIATEVPVDSGYIDNVMLTSNGEIVIIETKLWRNSELRRLVIAQCLDYVSSIQSMSYQEFENACLAGRGLSNSQASSLFELMASYPDALSEEKFIDAISYNLKRGRIVAIAAADGVRQETQSLSKYLQNVTSAQFNFALVELAVYASGKDYLVVPKTLLQTETVLRSAIQHNYTKNDNVSHRPKRSAHKRPTASIVKPFQKKT